VRFSELPARRRGNSHAPFTQKRKMNNYQIDWIGAIAAGIAAVIAFFVTKTILPRLSGKITYVVVGFLTLLLSLGLRLLLRHFGI
jgi:high-affinity Fe2+/Pb2+ permease